MAERYTDVSVNGTMVATVAVFFKKIRAKEFIIRNMKNYLMW